MQHFLLCCQSGYVAISKTFKGSNSVFRRTAISANPKGISHRQICMYLIDIKRYFGLERLG